jgi:ankyrin repeat protein
VQVELGEYENVQRLLQNGADANAANAGGERALSTAAKFYRLPMMPVIRLQYMPTALTMGDSWGRHDLVKLLLDFKADPNAKDKVREHSKP